MKKKFTIAAFVFGALTVICGIIVLFSFGTIDISIAIIPLLFFIACIQWVSAINKKEKADRQDSHVQ
ncbi:MAG: hypothetical protein E7192_01290 [Erysipelotrichaceae bacterium]|nr:hypothetical protein [Erysipelotrichaceae bacterium]